MGALKRILKLVNSFKIVFIIAVFGAGYWLSSTIAQAKLAKQLQVEIDKQKELQETLDKKRQEYFEIQTRLDDEIKKDKVYTDCTVPKSAKLLINSVK